MSEFFRCDCPVTSAVDLLGDRWIVVIVKQMLLEHKQSFKDFTVSDEAIASNILTSKLTQLLDFDIVTKSKRRGNKKSVYYHLTEKGLALAPLIVELALWSDANLRTVNPTMTNTKDLADMKSNKEQFISDLKSNYQKLLNSFDQANAGS